MTKARDISFEERWPILTKIMPKMLVIGCIWIGYQGFAWVLGNGEWPLTIPFSQPTLKSYQQYVTAAQQSQVMAHWVLGPLMILGTLFILRRPMFRLVRNRFKRTEEVEKAE